MSSRQSRGLSIFSNSPCSSSRYSWFCSPLGIQLVFTRIFCIQSRFMPYFTSRIEQIIIACTVEQGHRFVPSRLWTAVLGHWSGLRSHRSRFLYSIYQTLIETSPRLVFQTSVLILGYRNIIYSTYCFGFCQGLQRVSRSSATSSLLHALSNSYRRGSCWFGVSRFLMHLYWHLMRKGACFTFTPFAELL